MARKPKPQQSPHNQVKALARQVRDLRDEVEVLYHRLKSQSLETAQAIKQAQAPVYARMAEIDSRAPHLASLVEDARRAVDVLNRVELGLRPMLLQALKNERLSGAHWMEDSLDDAITLYRAQRPA